jgi:hypothetical protein
MRIILLEIAVIFILASNIFAQIDTTSLSYYPLNDGNYWEFLEELDDYMWPPGSQREYYSHKVIGDTLFPQNKSYKVIERKKLGSLQPPSYIFERIDSTNCNVYRYDTYNNNEILIDSLKSHPGDSCNASRTGIFGSTGTICTNMVTDIILNQPTFSKIFVEQHWHSPVEYKLSKRFGLTYLNYCFDFGQFTKHLLYAVIDSIEYGTQVNSIQNNNENLLNDFHLYQNYPNPFNSTTIILFELPQKSKVEITVYDVTGRKIKSLVSSEFIRGSHNIIWNGTNQLGQQVASGVYIYTLKATILKNKSESYIKSAKLILMK